ncbi:MAG: methyltransferase domain-containing protein [Ectothiorhodospiraceae bacterium]|nr:methyltransferase domain-containing protein [Ectothiorhodospiraceae bacterium]
MIATDIGTAAPSPAEVYDARFVPALFAQWAPTVLDCADVRGGQHVLDVACGTGVLARAAADRVGPQGQVFALDASPEMLAVARRHAEAITWREARAESIPFPDSRFDRVVSQFGMMFFDDPVAALREMRRVCRARGRIAVAVCDALDHCAGYAVLAELLHRLFGPGVADAFRAPFALGDRARLLALARSAGLDQAEVSVHSGTVRFASIDDLVGAERACAWTLGGLLDEAQLDTLLAEARVSLRPYADADGRVTFDMPALLLSA